MGLRFLHPVLVAIQDAKIVQRLGYFRQVGVPIVLCQLPPNLQRLLVVLPGFYQPVLSKVQDAQFVQRISYIRKVDVGVLQR